MYEPVEKTPKEKNQMEANGVSQIQNSHAPTSRFVDNRYEALQMRKIRDLAKNSPQNARLRGLHNLAAHSVTQKKRNGEHGFGFVDHRAEAVAQRKLQEMASNNPEAQQAAQLQAMANNYSAQQQPIIQKKENITKSDSGVIQLWRIRYQNLDTGATAIVENSLLDLPIEALEEISTNGFENVQLTGEDANPELLQEMASGVLAAKRGEQLREQNTPNRHPSGGELDDAIKQIQLPASLGGLAAEDPRRTYILQQLMRHSSGVRLNKSGVEVHLDIDQLKHQPKQNPIGSRQTKAGNTFDPSNSGSIAWHMANTLDYMADWASSLDNVQEGQRIFHGQARAVNEIHYEGFCVVLGGKKYVFFHCYPADGSNMKL